MVMPVLRQKNQVTIPAEAVRKAGIGVGEPLTVEVRRGRIILTKWVSKTADDDWYTDEVMAEIDEALEQTTGPGYATAADAIAALKRG